MRGISGKSCVVITSLALVLAMSQWAAAQRGGRGFGGASAAQLASLETVQAELKLTDEQRAQAAEINEALSNERRELFQGGAGGDFNQRREQLRKLSAEASAKVEALLDADQKHRLKEIYLQVNGAGALDDPEVAQALEISDEQQSQLADVAEANTQAMRDAFQNQGGASAEERREKFAELRREGDDKLLAVLSAEQRQQFETMQGAKIESIFRRFINVAAIDGAALQFLIGVRVASHRGRGDRAMRRFDPPARTCSARYGNAGTQRRRLTQIGTDGDV